MFNAELDSIIGLSPCLDLHVDESRWRYGKEGYNMMSDEMAMLTISVAIIFAVIMLTMLMRNA